MPTAALTFRPDIIRAAEIAMDCIRDATLGAEVSVELLPPERSWGSQAKASFLFTAPNEKPLRCECSFSIEESWWPDEGEFLGRVFWYDCRKAFSESAAWIGPKEGGTLPKVLKPR